MTGDADQIKSKDCSDSRFLIGEKILELGEFTSPAGVGCFYSFGIPVNNLVDSFAS